MKSKHGFRTYIWTKRLSQRNEPFDVRILALDALSLPWSGIKLDEMTRPDVLDEKLAATEPRFGARQMINARSDPAPWGVQKSPFGAVNKPVW